MFLGIDIDIDHLHHLIGQEERAFIILNSRFNLDRIISSLEHSLSTGLLIEIHEEQDNLRVSE